jgi:hypothetical protein
VVNAIVYAGAPTLWWQVRLIVMTMVIVMVMVLMMYEVWSVCSVE